MEQAVSILAIPLDQPELLFKNPAKLKDEWKALLKKWAPRRSDDDPSIAAHINALYQKAEVKIAAGLWETPGLWTLQGREEEYNIRYLRKHEFELGRLYIARERVFFAVRADHVDLFRNGVNRIKGLAFGSDKMRESFQRCVPTIEREVVTADTCLLVVRKAPDLILLRDVMTHLKGAIDPRHVAWIQNRCHNMGVYLDWQGLVHGAIGPDTVWVDPTHHSVALLGGWWYARHIGEPIKYLPAWAHAVAPPETKRDKMATAKLDQELIRAQGRELLGDRGGTRMTGPEPMRQFVRMPSGGTALDGLHDWDAKVLPAAFGPKKFVPWPLTADQVYPSTKE
jgi:hypothetical protein